MSLKDELVDSLHVDECNFILDCYRNRQNYLRQQKHMITSLYPETPETHELSQKIEKQLDHLKELIERSSSPSYLVISWDVLRTDTDFVINYMNVYKEKRHAVYCLLMWDFERMLLDYSREVCTCETNTRSCLSEKTCVYTEDDIISIILFLKEIKLWNAGITLSIVQQYRGKQQKPITLIDSILDVKDKSAKIFEETGKGLFDEKLDLDFLKPELKHVYWMMLFNICNCLLTHNGEYKINVGMKSGFTGLFSLYEFCVFRITVKNINWIEVILSVLVPGFSCTDFIFTEEIRNDDTNCIELIRSKEKNHIDPMEILSKDTNLDDFVKRCYKVVDVFERCIIKGFTNEEDKFNLLYYEFDHFNESMKPQYREKLSKLIYLLRTNPDLILSFEKEDSNATNDIKEHFMNWSEEYNFDINCISSIDSIELYIQHLSEGEIPSQRKLLVSPSFYEILTPLLYMIRSEKYNETDCLAFADKLSKTKALFVADSLFALLLGAHYGYWKFVKILIETLISRSSKSDYTTQVVAITQLFKLALRFDWEVSPSIIDTVKDYIFMGSIFDTVKDYIFVCTTDVHDDYFPSVFLSYIVHKKNLSVLKNVNHKYKKQLSNVINNVEIQSGTVDLNVKFISDDIVVGFDDICDENNEDFWVYFLRLLPNMTDHIIDKALTKTSLKIFQALVCKKIGNEHDACTYLKKAIYNNRFDIMEWLVNQFPLLLTTIDDKKKMIPLQHAFKSGNIEMCNFLSQDRFLKDNPIMLEKLNEIIDDSNSNTWMTEENMMEFRKKIELMNDIEDSEVFVKEDSPKCQYCKWGQCDGTFEKKQKIIGKQQQWTKNETNRQKKIFYEIQGHPKPVSQPAHKKQSSNTKKEDKSIPMIDNTKKAVDRSTPTCSSTSLTEHKSKPTAMQTTVEEYYHKHFTVLSMLPFHCFEMELLEKWRNNPHDIKIQKQLVYKYGLGCQQKQRHDCQIDDFIFSILHQALGSGVKLKDEMMERQYEMYKTEKKKYIIDKDGTVNTETVNTESEQDDDRVGSRIDTTHVSSGSEQDDDCVSCRNDTIEKTHVSTSSSVINFYKDAELSFANLRIDEDDDDDGEQTKNMNKNKKNKKPRKKEDTRICLHDFLTNEEKGKQMKNKRQNARRRTTQTRMDPQVDFPKVLTAKDERLEDHNDYVYRKAVSKSLPTKAPDITDIEEFPKKI